jgi:hypothetical protein
VDFEDLSMNKFIKMSMKMKREVDKQLFLKRWSDSQPTAKSTPLFWVKNVSSFGGLGECPEKVFTVAVNIYGQSQGGAVSWNIY